MVALLHLQPALQKHWWLIFKLALCFGVLMISKKWSIKWSLLLLLLWTLRHGMLEHDLLTFRHIRRTCGSHSHIISLLVQADDLSLEVCWVQTDYSLLIHLELRLVCSFCRHWSPLSMVAGVKFLRSEGRRILKISDAFLSYDSVTEKLMLLFDLFNRFWTEHNLIFVLLDHQILGYFVVGRFWRCLGWGFLDLDMSLYASFWTSFNLIFEIGFVFVN